MTTAHKLGLAVSVGKCTYSLQNKVEQRSTTCCINTGKLKVNTWVAGDLFSTNLVINYSTVITSGHVRIHCDLSGQMHRAVLLPFSEEAVKQHPQDFRFQ